MTHYQITHFLKLAEKDDFNFGCDPKTVQSTIIELQFDSNCLADLISNAAKFLGVTDKKNILLNACEDAGRIDFSVMETSEGGAATESDFEQWKNGQIELWAVTYTAHVKIVSDCGEIEPDILEQVKL